MSSNLEWALKYASYGWPVLPLVAGSKVPVTEHGCKDATTDTDTIREWWRCDPEFNVAIATGPGSVDVIDIDVPGDWSRVPEIVKLRNAGLLPAHIMEVRTRSNGTHLYFPGTNQRNAVAIGGRGSRVDFRSANGYVVAAPSFVQADKKAGAGEYRIRNKRDYINARSFDLAAATTLLRPKPYRLMSEIGQPPHRRSALSCGSGFLSTLRKVENAENGARQDTFFKALSTAHERGFTDSQVDTLAQAALDTGLEPHEVNSLLRRYARGELAR
jgi:hypothetical protein